MQKKTCPYCFSPSFSSSTRGEPWMCPKCTKDITHIPAEAPEPNPDDDEVKQRKSWLKSV